MNRITDQQLKEAAAEVREQMASGLPDCPERTEDTIFDRYPAVLDAVRELEEEKKRRKARMAGWIGFAAAAAAAVILFVSGSPIFRPELQGKPDAAWTGEKQSGDTQVLAPGQQPGGAELNSSGDTFSDEESPESASISQPNDQIPSSDGDQTVPSPSKADVSEGSAGVPSMSVEVTVPAALHKFYPVEGRTGSVQALVREDASDIRDYSDDEILPWLEADLKDSGAFRLGRYAVYEAGAGLDELEVVQDPGTGGWYCPEAREGHRYILSAETESGRIVFGVVQRSSRAPQE
ncbi:MAG: hypothetical protein J6Z23_06005 [Lachnospiraceae bacterium]|nr:hypothetical protein [Lachnospiraceae bacterium]